MPFDAYPTGATRMCHTKLGSLDTHEPGEDPWRLNNCVHLKALSPCEMCTLHQCFTAHPVSCVGMSGNNALARAEVQFSFQFPTILRCPTSFHLHGKCRDLVLVFVLHRACWTVCGWQDHTSLDWRRCCSTCHCSHIPQWPEKKQSLWGARRLAWRKRPLASRQRSPKYPSCESQDVISEDESEIHS